MLSAIAARKAAQAAQPPPEAPPNGISPQNIPHRPSPPPSSSESDLEPAPAPPRKRKAQEADSPRKKRPKKKNRFTNADFGRPRYFDVQQPIQGFDDEPTFASDIPDESAPTSRPYSPSQPIPDVELIETEMESRLVSETPGPSRGFSPSRPIPDSSEDEDDALGNHPESGEPRLIASSTEARQQHTTFIPTLNSNTFRLTDADIKSLHIPSDTVNPSDAVILLLAPGTSLSFVGAVSVTLLQGAITILGTPITPSRRAHRVFSPRSSPLASLGALDAQSSEGDVSSFRRIFPNGNLPQRVQGELKTSDSILIVEPLKTGVDGLGKVCRTFDGVFEVDSELRGGEADAIGLYGFHLVDPHARPHPQLQPFYLPESWEKALDTVAPRLLSHNADPLTSTNTSFVGLVRGPKKCGKSTFARTLLNRLTIQYRHVAFLECDIGQSEFTPGGMVSLHVISNPILGPPFTHPRLPYRAHYVGHVTPRSNPSYYLSCIEALVQTYRMDVQYAYHETYTGEFSQHEEGIENDERIEGLVPLVVNTQGWMKGLGGDLLRKIEEIAGPTHVFDLDMQSNAFPQQRTQSATTRTHTLQSIPTSPLAAYYTAADHRSLAILSYFHSIFPSERADSEVLQWGADVPLCARPPWDVNCREAIDQIVLVGAGYEDVVPQELDCAINCGVVALVCDEDSTSAVDAEYNTDRPFPYTQGAPAPDPSSSHCTGLALIRGVDASTHRLHVLTPLPRAVLARCRVLVKGELELPVWGMLDFREGQDGVAGVPWGKVPYLQMSGQGAGVGTIGAGAGRKRVRRNLMRRAQM